MNPTAVAIVAFVLGLVLGAVIIAVTRRGTERPPEIDFESDQPVVPEGVSEVLAVLRSSAVVVGPHDEVLQASSPARTLGLARGSRVAVPELLELVRDVRSNQQILTADLEIKRGRGTASTFLSARVAPLTDDLIVILAEDRTAERRIEDTRRDFVANVSHELKTPIGAISLLAEAVEDAADDPPAVRRFATRMGIESARLTDLVAQIIDLSRLQADNPLAQAEEVDIDEVLSDAVDRCRVDADRHQVSLTIAGVQGTRVLGSARQLTVAVGNLVENAVIYSDSGARVVVAAHVMAQTDDDYVEITVSDNGIGIPAADVDRVFERFYRVDYARSRANGGTGLGLSIVKHIAAVHGGQIGVWSQPGRGSTFTMSIPAHLNRPAESAGTHTHEPTGASSTTRSEPICGPADGADPRQDPGEHGSPVSDGPAHHDHQETTR